MAKQRTQRADKSKRGIYGWRAFVLVFVSGTLGAFLVMGLIVGTLRLVVSGFTGGGGQSSGDQVGTQPRQPREAMEVGGLDLCKVTDTDVLAGKGNERVDPDEGPVDTGQEGGEGATDRTVTDECEWDFTVATHGPASLRLEYTAFVSDSESQTKEEMAAEEYESQLASVDGVFANMEGEGPAENTLAESRYFFGETSSGEAGYLVVGQMKSAVYVALFSDSEIPEDFQSSYASVFRAEVYDLDRSISTEIRHRLPD